MKSRNRTGKIARLPENLRQELNERLSHGEAGESLPVWLNGLPEVQAMVNAEFEGVPIGDDNISQWRKGGYLDWLDAEDSFEVVRRLQEGGAEFLEDEKEEEADLGKAMEYYLSSRNALATKRAGALEGKEKWALWQRMCLEVARLRQGDIQAGQLELSEERLAWREEIETEHHAAAPAERAWEAKYRARAAAKRRGEFTEEELAEGKAETDAIFQSETEEQAAYYRKLRHDAMDADALARGERLPDHDYEMVWNPGRSSRTRHRVWAGVAVSVSKDAPVHGAGEEGEAGGGAEGGEAAAETEALLESDGVPRGRRAGARLAMETNGRRHAGSRACCRAGDEHGSGNAWRAAGGSASRSRARSRSGAGEAGTAGNGFGAVLPDARPAERLAATPALPVDAMAARNRKRADRAERRTGQKDQRGRDSGGRNGRSRAGGSRGRSPSQWGPAVAEGCPKKIRFPFAVSLVCSSPFLMTLKIYIDGTFYPEAEAKISVFDHGLLYGDGVFEGIRFYNGRVFRLDEHLERLWESARAICLTIPLTVAEMEKSVLETIRQNELRDGYIRLLVTRGKGNLGLSPDRCPKASVIIIASTIQLYPEEKYDTRDGDGDDGDPASLAGGAEPGGEVAELSEQHHGQDRGHARRRG